MNEVLITVPDRTMASLYLELTTGPPEDKCIMDALFWRMIDHVGDITEISVTG